jgi:hypothetical protein
MPLPADRSRLSLFAGAALLGGCLAQGASGEVHIRPSNLIMGVGATQPTDIDIDEDGVADIGCVQTFGSMVILSLHPDDGARFADLDPSSGFYGLAGQTLLPEAALPFAIGSILCWQWTFEGSGPTIPMGRHYFPIVLQRDGAPHAAWIMADVDWVQAGGEHGWWGLPVQMFVRQIAWEDEPWTPMELGWSDCDQDGVSDLEQTAANPAIDCDGNALPDSCDIAAGWDCNGNGVNDLCDLASGTATDCNKNGALDECDIAVGTSDDCNGNGVPDECDLMSGVLTDCNGNGLMDACEITSGLVHDCDADGVPDECQLLASPMEGNVSLAMPQWWAQASVPSFGMAMPTEEITIEFWQKAFAIESQTTFRVHWSGTNRCMAEVPGPDGRITWCFGESSAGDPSPAGQLSYEPPESVVGTWQHFTLQASKAGGFMRIYRNGVLEASKSESSTFAPSDAPLFLGGPFQSAINGFSGGLDEFRIWNSIRTPEEINAHLTTPVDPATPGLVAYWPMDEATGAVLHDLVAARNATFIGPNGWWTDVLHCDSTADLNQDGHVDAADLALLLGAWGSPCRACPEDLDESGSIDAADLAVLLGQWS